MNQQTSSIRRLPTEILDRLGSKLGRVAYQRLLRPPRQHESQRELFSMAGHLHRAGFEEYERELVLRAWFEAYHREISDREIERAVTRAGGGTSRGRPRWPQPRESEIARVLRESAGALERLRALSSPGPEAMSPGEIIDLLFGQDDLICMASEKNAAYTAPRDLFRGREPRHQFIVPNAMSASTGLTDEGRISRRCNSNTGPVMYQVVEFDRNTQDEQAALHLHLARHAGLLLVVFSGNKSLHGWYDMRQALPERLEKFQRFAASLGADPAMFVPCQLARTPNARRDNGSIQTALFISPHAI